MNDLNNMDNEEVVKLFIDTMKKYVKEFYDKIDKNKITCRFATNVFDSHNFYMDYFALSRKYNKKEAKEALNVFKKYCDALVIYLEILKNEYKDIEFHIGKTEVSSALIGKELFVVNFPYKLPKLYEDDM